MQVITQQIILQSYSFAIAAHGFHQRGVLWSTLCMITVALYSSLLAICFSKQHWLATALAQLLTTERMLLDL